MAALRAALLLTLLLPACAERPEEVAAAMRQAAATARASMAAAGATPAAPWASASATAGAAPLQSTAARPPVGPRLRGAGAPSAAAALVGASAAEARRMLGEPSLRRPEGEAEIWLYEAAECRLDLVLYPERGAPVVAHAAARAHGAAAVTEAACLAAIAADPGAPRGT